VLVCVAAWTHQGVGRASGLRAVRSLAAPVLPPPTSPCLHHHPAPWNDWCNLPVVGMTLRGHGVNSRRFHQWKATSASLRDSVAKLAEHRGRMKRLVQCGRSPTDCRDGAVLWLRRSGWRQATVGKFIWCSAEVMSIVLSVSATVESIGRDNTLSDSLTDYLPGVASTARGLTVGGSFQLCRAEH
jgi:hypothetical protein